MSARMLMACRACGRQYEVTHLGDGTRVRCACGATFAVRHVLPHAPRAARCSSCAAPLQGGAAACSFCGAEVALHERQLDSLCPVCYARSASQAKYCMECGVELHPQAILALPESARCPRCLHELTSRSLGEQSVAECGRCAGLFLRPEHFERLIARADERRVVLAELERRTAAAASVDAERVAYLRCPLCPDMMVRRNFGGGSGVILDLCRDHGIWLDHHELEKILAFVHAGGLKVARERELERLSAERERARAQRCAPPPSSTCGETGHRALQLDLVQLLDWLGRLFHHRSHR
ncbi:MAG: zf-TFIIB domain-containing protein [Planctomycetota bacterium]